MQLNNPDLTNESFLKKNHKQSLHFRHKNCKHYNINDNKMYAFILLDYLTLL